MPIPKRVQKLPEPDLHLRQRLLDTEDVTQSVVHEYLAGASIRDLAAALTMSYGWVRETLLKGGVELRTRGGARYKQSDGTYLM